MTREELDKRFCVLGSLVAALRYEYAFAADCFCPDVAVFTGDYWRWDEQIIEYIEKAVIKAIAKDSLCATKADVRAEHKKRLEA